MAENLTENNELKNYLLGNIILEAERERIEERLMLDERYFEQLNLTEEELVQSYADDELNDAERLAFEKYFFVSEENYARVKFARAFSSYINRQKNLPGAKTETKPEKPFRSFFSFFSFSPAPVVAAVLVVIACFGAWAAWYLYPFSSDTKRALTSLNRAYRAARPLESRITSFDYAPFNKVRGAENLPAVDQNEQRRAEMILRDDVARRPTAENRQALGRLYVSKKQFDEALDEFQKAQKLISGANAEIYNDLGVAYLEKYKALPDGEPDKKPELSYTALENFDRALEIDPKLPEAAFNRAVCLETLNLPNQAKEAWRKYLELDSVSAWADEARSRLQTLEASRAVDVSADEQEQLFLNAYAEKRDGAAFEIASRNRELITGKYLPQKLAFSIVEASAAERNAKLEALKYLAALEKKNNADAFAADLAEVYSELPESKLDLLREAQSAIRRGYALCLEKNGFSKALEEFTLARKFFLEAGDFVEAETISQYFIAYCLYNLKRRPEALEIFARIDDFAERKNYQWFALMNSQWLLGAEKSLGLKTITDVQNESEKALRKAEQMKDVYLTQKFLLLLVVESHFVKQQKKTFAYLQKLLESSNQPNISVRQKFRNFDKVIEVTAANHFNGLSKAVVLESVSLAEAMTDPAFIIGSEINAGIVHTRSGNFKEAEEWFRRARENAERVSETAQKNSDLARIFLHLGHLERNRGEHRAAVGYYDASFDISEKTDSPLQLYEIKKSRLLAYQAAGDAAAVEKDLASTLELAEKYRKEILDEQERHSFFDNEQTVFDVAVEHEIQKNRFEQAYDYAEAANSRSLLDWLKKGATVSSRHAEDKILFDGSTTPLKIAELRKRIPPEVEILQYTVLENKVLIWLVSSERFSLITSDVKSAELKAKIDDYLGAIKTARSDSPDETKNLSRELYRMLVEPAAAHLSKNREIYLIPNKFLFYLPFSTLLSAEEKFLLEDFVVSYSPSLNVFVLCTDDARRKAEEKTEKILSVGNPAFDSNKLSDLANLPESASEARAVADNYSESKVLRDRAATKQNFLDAYQNHEVVHFAGHYVAQPDSPLSSKLIMANAEDGADDFLTNAELLDKKLPRAKLIVLSACQTGVEGYYNGEGLLGLSRTFLAAGAPLVVASQWKVDSKATKELMEKFHRYRRQANLSTSRALRQSQMDLLNDPRGGFRSPYFWAGFAVFGGYANF